MTAPYELISVSLEIIAFFFVTIDLYGKDRLKTADEKLTKATEFLVTRCMQTLRIWSSAKEDDKNFPIVGTGLGTVFLSIPVIYFLVYAAARMFASVESQPLLSIAVGFLLFFFILSGIGATAFTILFIFTAIVAFANWMLGRLKFSGLLLSAGAIMFLIAKGMVWWHLFEEVRG
jgi:hypothetical protein